MISGRGQEVGQFRDDPPAVSSGLSAFGSLRRRGVVFDRVENVEDLTQQTFDAVKGAIDAFQ